ncbi:MAG: hypothetical protein ABIH36_02740 [bacterium]
MMLEISQLKSLAAKVRLRCLELWEQNSAPFSGSLSIVDVYVSYFADHLQLTERGLSGFKGTRTICKGTSANAVYATLQECGIRWDDTENVDSLFPPVLEHAFPGCNASVLKLGTGIDQAIGLAFMLKRQYNPAQITVFISEGDINCGVDHQASTAEAWGLDNLTVVLDCNGLLSTQPASTIDRTLIPGTDGKLNRLKSIWTAYGWEYYEVDGHDFDQLRDAFAAERCKRPRIIVARTVKGKGISFVESKIGYEHGLPERELVRARAELAKTARERSASVVLPHDCVISNESRFAHAPTPIMMSAQPVPPTDKMVSVFADLARQMIAENPDRVFLINCDCPVPFGEAGTVFPTDPDSHWVFVGVNEKMAMNVARGMTNAGALPVVVASAPHLQVCAEEMKLCGLDRSPVLMVGYAPGTELCRWGPSHNCLHDVHLFRGPGTHVYQPATTDDLVQLMRYIYADPANRLPGYLRLPKAVVHISDDATSPSIDDVDRGWYLVTGTLTPDVLLVTSGRLLKPCFESQLLLHARGLSTSVVNVLILSSLDPTELAPLADSAKTIVSVIDADPDSLRQVLAPALPRSALSRVVSLGVSDYGDQHTLEKIDSLNKLDASGICDAASN